MIIITRVNYISSLWMSHFVFFFLTLIIIVSILKVVNFFQIYPSVYFQLNSSVKSSDYHIIIKPQFYILQIWESEMRLLRQSFRRRCSPQVHQKWKMGCHIISTPPQLLTLHSSHTVYHQWRRRLLRPRYTNGGQAATYKREDA